MRNKMLFFVFLVSALVVLSGQVRAEGYVDGLRDGINQCKNDPASCGITTSYDAGYTEGEKAGKKSCEGKLYSQTDYDKRYEEGKATCNGKLYSQDDYNKHYTAAQTACKNDPASCGITDDNGSKQDGINQCKNNPASCEITVNYDNNGSTADGIKTCQDKPSDCGINFTDTNGSTADGVSQCTTGLLAFGINVTATTPNPNEPSKFKLGLKECEGKDTTTCKPYSLDTNGSTADGINQCKADMLAFGINVTATTPNPNEPNKFKLGLKECEGKDATCKPYSLNDDLLKFEIKPVTSTTSNPDGTTTTSTELKCSVENSVACQVARKGVDQGVDQCKADTVTCGITNPNDYHTRKKTFDEDKAVKNAKADGKLAILDLKTKILHLPTVSVIYEQGNPVTYEQVHMSLAFTSQGKENSFPHYLFQLNEATAAKP